MTDKHLSNSVRFIDTGTSLNGVPVFATAVGQELPPWLTPQAHYEAELAILAAALNIAYDEVLAAESRCAMLARRCAEQAKQIADIVNPPSPPSGDVFTAIATHQKQGVR